MTGRGLRIVALADSDSYVKWCAALLGGLPDRMPGVDVALVLVETPVLVSRAQEEAALVGSGLDPARVHRVSYQELGGWLDAFQADAVLLAARGPAVRVFSRVAAAREPRPVIVTGLPGISIPAKRGAVVYRAQCDLFVVHSVREMRAFEALAAQLGIPQRFALARLPFASAAAKGPVSGTDLVFAAQAIVPRARHDRQRIARLLIETARADPRRRVVVKLRSAAGERETHHEREPYPRLLEAFGAPPNVVVSHEPMGQALDTAEGLVTVSSTAAVEAVARGIPVIALDTFGVSKDLINQVFVDSGLLAGEEDVIARWFRHPDPDWLEENYFHDESLDDWTQRLEELVRLRRSGGLPAREPHPRLGGALRDAWDRKSVLGAADRSLIGRFAMVAGMPLRQAILTARRLRDLVRRPAVEGMPDVVASPEAVVEPLRR